MMLNQQIKRQLSRCYGGVLGDTQIQSKANHFLCTDEKNLDFFDYAQLKHNLAYQINWRLMPVRSNFRLTLSVICCQRLHANKNLAVKFAIRYR